MFSRSPRSLFDLSLQAAAAATNRADVSELLPNALAISVERVRSTLARVNILDTVEADFLQKIRDMSTAWWHSAASPPHMFLFPDSFSRCNLIASLAGCDVD
jgi:hypothetical protein